MAQIETVDDLAEYLADQMGIYGTSCDVQDCGCKDVCNVWPCKCNSGVGNHSGDCMCRMCFTSDMKRRIRESVANEARVK